METSPKAAPIPCGRKDGIAEEVVGGNRKREKVLIGDEQALREVRLLSSPPCGRRGRGGSEGKGKGGGGVIISLTHMRTLRLDAVVGVRRG